MSKNPKEILAKGMSLPRDVIFGDFVVTLTGNQEIYIENYKGIIKYDAAQITIQGNHIGLRINGNHLVIKYYSLESMKITGNISQLEYFT